MSQQVGHAGDQFVEIERLGLKRLLTRERKQSLGQLRGTPGAIGGGVGIALGPRIALADTAAQEIERADHNGQHVVEIMRDTAGELADRLHLLCLPQRLVRLLQLARALDHTLLELGIALPDPASRAAGARSRATPSGVTKSTILRSSAAGSRGSRWYIAKVPSTSLPSPETTGIDQQDLRPYVKASAR